MIQFFTQMTRLLLLSLTLSTTCVAHSEQDFHRALAQNLLNYHLSNETSYLEQLKLTLSASQVSATQTDLENFRREIQSVQHAAGVTKSIPTEVQMFLELGQTLQQSDFQLYASDVRHRAVNRERLRLIKEISHRCNIHSLNVEMASRVRSRTLTNLIEQIYGSVDDTVIENEVRKHKSKIQKRLEEESERALLYIYRFTPTKNLHATQKWCSKKTLSQAHLASLAVR